MRIDYFKGNHCAVIKEQDEKLILIVESSDFIRRLVSRNLSLPAVTIQSCCNEMDVLEKAATGFYDLIVMDLALPDIDCLQTTQKIREAEAKNKLPRITIMAVTTLDKKGKCLASGMDDCIPTPLSDARVRAVLDRWVVTSRHLRVVSL